MTYGVGQAQNNVDYYCGNCGTYLIQNQVHTGKKGEYRCNFCNNQVRTKPRVTKTTIQNRKQKRVEMKNLT